MAELLGHHDGLLVGRARVGEPDLLVVAFAERHAVVDEHLLDAPPVGPVGKIAARIGLEPLPDHANGVGDEIVVSLELHQVRLVALETLLNK